MGRISLEAWEYQQALAAAAMAKAAAAEKAAAEKAAAEKAFAGSNASGSAGTKTTTTTTTAAPVTEYILDMSISPVPDACSVLVQPYGTYVSPGRLKYRAGTQVTLKAGGYAADLDGLFYTFDKWVGATGGNPTVITMDSNKSITVVCKSLRSDDRQKFLVATSVSPVNSGTVTPSKEYEQGSGVSIIAQPMAGYGFSKWQGDIQGAQYPTKGTLHIPSLNEARNIVAVFSYIGMDVPAEPGTPGVSFYHITLDVKGNGSIKISPQKDIYAVDELINIEAVPQSGYQFKGWSGDYNGNELSINVKMPARNLSFTATFETVTTTNVNEFVVLATEIISVPLIEGSSGVGNDAFVPLAVATLTIPVVSGGGFVELAVASMALKMKLASTDYPEDYPDIPEEGNLTEKIKDNLPLILGVGGAATLGALLLTNRSKEKTTDKIP
ncbi:MAG: hypothetical protein WAO71_03580 [Gallionella sp.]